MSVSKKLHTEIFFAHRLKKIRGNIGDGYNNSLIDK